MNHESMLSRTLARIAPCRSCEMMYQVALSTNRKALFVRRAIKRWFCQRDLRILMLFYEHHDPWIGSVDCICHAYEYYIGVRLRPNECVESLMNLHMYGVIFVEKLPAKKEEEK